MTRDHPGVLSWIFGFRNVTEATAALYGSGP